MSNNRYLDTFALMDSSPLSFARQRSYGFPQPSERFLSPAATATRYYFSDETKWSAILEYGDFDDIVIGTGFCALAYIDKALQLNPKRRILVLERGGLWLMSHFQNLSLPFDMLLNNASETYPWALTPATFHSDIKYVRGCFPFFGGRSLFWSAWSPRPSLELMRNFPRSLLATAGEENFWSGCRNLLNVVEPNQLYGGDYQALQRYIGERVDEAISARKDIAVANYAEPANLAVGGTTGVSGLVFEKFSTPGPLLKLYERQRKLANKGEGSPLTIATDVVVERFEIDPLDPAKRFNVLHTSRGALCSSLPKKPNIILATGAIPACTIVLNSVQKQHGRAGSRLSGHFRTRIDARFLLPGRFCDLRHEEWEERKKRGGKGAIQKQDEALEIAAYYLSGRDPITGLQYHGEVTVTHSPLAEEQHGDAARLCPDFFSAPTEVQLEGSQNHIIVACVMLGEIDETNSECWIRFNRERINKTTNIDVQLTLSERDKRLREVMYRATLQAINALASDKSSSLEYWHDNGHGGGGWDKSEPDQALFQTPGVIHPSSTLYMDDTVPLHPNLEPESESPSPSRPSVDRNYRVYGTGNVYVTGSAIFPTSGSWNPTLTMCGFAQDLAIKLHKRSVFRQVFLLSIVSNQLYRLNGTIESLLNALRRRVNDAFSCLDPSGLSNRRNTWQLNWGPVVWKDGIDASTTGPDLSWYVVYHDNLEFEDGSLHPTYVIVVAGTSGMSVNDVVDFDAYVSGGQFKTPPTEVSTDALDTNKAYFTLSMARAVQTLLTSPAPSVAGVKTLLSFINEVKSAKDLVTRTPPRFIFTGHGVGGTIASTTALSLVSGDVIPADRTLTYSTGGPSPGNAPFANLFQRTFRARQTNGADGYETWNVNLVNTLDVVPQAWCHQHHVSPRQNLNNVPVIYGTPIIIEAFQVTDALVAGASNSGIVFKPLPSCYFTGTSPSAPPGSVEDFLRIAFGQHVQAYINEIRVTVPEPKPDAPKDGVCAKTEGDVRLNYPVIRDFEQAYRGFGSCINGGDAGTGTSAEAGSRSGPGAWFGARFGFLGGTKTGTAAGTGVETKSEASTESRTNGTGNGTTTKTEIGNGAGTETSNETGSGRVAVTPLPSLTVLKYGNPDYNLIPQSTQQRPLLIYRSCFPDSASVSEVKSHLQSVAVVEPHRTGTLPIRDHFYPATHKVLCITNGQVQLRFGGEGNPSKVDVEVRKGEVVVIPAGIPHRLLKDIGRDLEVVESYPKGVNVDSDSRRLGSRPQQTHIFTIASLAWFTKDPIYGDQGPVLGC